jgi:hypothetical protein
MFYETVDILQLLKIFFSNPHHLLIWITELGIQKWIIIVLIVAL